MLNNVDLNTVSDKIIQLALTNNTPKIYISGPVSMYNIHLRFNMKYDVL